MYFARRTRWKGQTLAALSAAVILAATSFAGVPPVAASRGVPLARAVPLAESATVSSTCPVIADPVADVNMDGGVGLSDLGNISGRWGAISPNGCGGWIRADANSDGAIGLGDYGKVTAKWGQTGYVPPSSVTQIIFVHGIAADSTDVHFSGLLDGVSAFAVAHSILYEDFQYIQDKHRNNDGSCTPRSVMLPGGYSIANKINWTGWDQAICDSNSDIGFNALALWQEVVTNYNDGNPGKRVPPHGKTILIANSMGAAIVRGMLAYSTDLGDKVASTIVDSVFFIEGAQSGSWIDAVTTPVQLLPFSGSVSQAKLDWKTDRPAVEELKPGSSWYSWANSYTPPNIPYFNAYGDIDLVEQVCVPYGCNSISEGIGDIVFLSEEADFHPYPFDANHKEYDLRGTIYMDPNNLSGNLESLTNMPVSHLNLPSQVDQVQVFHCMTQPSSWSPTGSWSLAQEYGNLIYRRVVANSSPTCDPNNWTDITS